MESTHKADYGKFVLSAGKFYGDAEKDKGEIVLSSLMLKASCSGFNAHFVSKFIKSLNDASGILCCSNMHQSLKKTNLSNSMIRVSFVLIYIFYIYYCKVKDIFNACVVFLGHCGVFSPLNMKRDQFTLDCICITLFIFRLHTLRLGQFEPRIKRIV